MQIQQFQQHLQTLGARACHQDSLLRNWLQGHALDSGRWHKRHPLPRAIQTNLATLDNSLKSLARLHSSHPSEDGSTRLLVKLADGQTVESVLLPRNGLCISTQVGCAVGCLFCMTGKEGLLRQLSGSEILAQVALARTMQPVDKVVFMGMGEPAHNMENVLDAIELLGTLGGIPHKNLVFSSVGDHRLFERLSQEKVKPALALSLHTTDPKLRIHLLPHAPKIDPIELVEMGEAYARATGYPIQYQWTLLKGVNDTQEELTGIIKLLKGKYAILNLIPYNQTDGLDFKRPDQEDAAAMARHLHCNGILTKLRRSAGQDIEGGCGQLRARIVSLEGGISL